MREEALTVSIVTGCHQSEQFIQRIFESIARQTASPYEWIAVVDGRLDGTEDRLRQLALQSCSITMRLACVGLWLLTPLQRYRDRRNCIIIEPGRGARVRG